MVDGDGYLHLSFDHHGNKLNYCKSTAPGALTLGEKEAMTGEDEEDVPIRSSIGCRMVICCLYTVQELQEEVIWY